MGSSSAVSKDALVVGGGAGHEHDQHRLRAMAARTVTDSLRAAVARSGGAAEKAARLEECARSLEAEKAKMEVFRRELPISVHLIADVIEWLKDEVAQHRTSAAAPGQLLVAPLASRSPSPAKRKAEGVKTEADASDKRSWMSSAQLWTCGGHSCSSTSNGGSDRKQGQKVATTGIHRGADGRRPSAYHRLALGVWYADGDPRHSSSGKVSLGTAQLAVGVEETVGVEGEGRGRRPPVGVLALGVAS